MDGQRVLATGAVAIVFAAVFMVGGRIYPARALFRDEASLVSFSAGIALAYVFIHVMPELNTARDTFLQVTLVPHVFAGGGVYFVAMLGFLFFYSMDQLNPWTRLAKARSTPSLGFDLKLAGFAGYVCLISYLLVNNLENSALASGAYALAMVVHLLTFDHAFRKERGESYARRGHLLLAAAALVGWGLGVAIAAPRGGLAMMLAFLSGGVIVNTAILELPTSSSGNMWPFVVGAVVYGGLLINLR